MAISQPVHRPADRRGFVIMAQHRSGSSFLHNLVKVHPEAESINEPFSQHMSLFRDVEMDRWTAADVTEARYHPSVAPGSGVHRRLESLSRWLEADYELHGFKETLLFRKLDWLDAVFRPRAYVYLARDPRATMASLLRLGDVNAWWSYPGFAERLITSGVVQSPPAYRATPLEQTAVVWRARAEWLLAQSVHPRWITVRLEDMVADPDRVGTTLMTHLGKTWTARQSDWVQKSWSGRLQHRRADRFSSARSKTEVTDAWQRDLDREQIATVERICGPIMATLGYRL